MHRYESIIWYLDVKESAVKVDTRIPSTQVFGNSKSVGYLPQTMKIPQGDLSYGIHRLRCHDFMAAFGVTQRHLDAID